METLNHSQFNIHITKQDIWSDHLTFRLFPQWIVALEGLNSDFQEVT